MNPSKLFKHDLWWKGPSWLHHNLPHQPKQLSIPPSESKDEERELTLHTVSSISSFLLNISDYFSFIRLKQITAWIL